MRIFECKHCKKLFWDTVRVFCTSQCRKAFEAEQRKTKDFKKTRAGNGWKEYQLFKKNFIKKYNHLCQKCGDRGWIVHHFKKVSDFPNLEIDETNMILLCLPCHRKEHPELPDSLFVYENIMQGFYRSPLFLSRV